jgi:hypothetical protein
LTDGQEDGVDKIIAEAKRHAHNHRFFCLGIGSGADPGLVEGLASATQGQADFVHGDEDLSRKVIPQLAMARLGAITEIQFHLDGFESVEVTPFPIPPIGVGMAKTVFVKSARLTEKDLMFEAKVCGTRTDFPCTKKGDPVVGQCLPGLFAYEMIQDLTMRMKNPMYQPVNVTEFKNQCIALSISSGVLSDFTAFVGFSEKVFQLTHSFEGSGTRSSFETSDSDSDLHPRPLGNYRPGTIPIRSGWTGIVIQPRLPRMQSSLEPQPVPASPPIPAPRRPTPVAPRPVEFTSITALQDIAGYWTEPKALATLVGIQTIAVFDDLKGHGQGKSVFASVLAIAILRKRFGADRVSWSLIEEKCLKWLASQIQGVEALISRAEALLPSS